ncbi:elongator complex protein 3 [Thiovibrio sp. JS02]
MSPPFVIPIFISHQGCPHRCLFCNQRSITGMGEELNSPAQVREIIRGQLAWPRRGKQAPVQVAFYGGSFTGLPRGRQEELLVAVQPFLRSGQVQEIRLSTRPDYVSPEIARFLWEHGVRTVELGAQSLADSVLALSARGHTAAQVQSAVRALRTVGMRIGIQLMLGLPGDTTALAVKSAQAAAALAPDLVRLYPCLVIGGSPLEILYRNGGYQPLGLARAVALAGRLWRIFAGVRIPVVRMGLQPSASLEAGLLAGPYHPAFGELVLSRLFFTRVRALLAGRARHASHTLIIARADESIHRGQANRNVRRLDALGLLAGVSTVYSDTQPRQSVTLRLS